MTPVDIIWNRAWKGVGPNACSGDRALAALLKAHGLAMNGGVLHAVECLKSSVSQWAQILSLEQVVFEGRQLLG